MHDIGEPVRHRPQRAQRAAVRSLAVRGAESDSEHQAAAGYVLHRHRDTGERDRATENRGRDERA